MTEDEPELAAAEDRPIRYIDRTRAYYGALGFPPYRWARNASAPFAPLWTPLAACRVTIVTTAAPVRPEAGEQGPGAAYNGAAKFFEVYTVASDGEPDLRISHVAYDRDHTSAADPGTWLPLPALREAARAGRIGEVGPRVHGLSTNRSQRVTMETDAPELLARCRDDGADAVILVPNCPVCHQSVTLAARHLEAAGLPTVVMGAAQDIVEHAGAPRFLFSDVPLGNSAGRPHDPASQAATLGMALTLLESAAAARTTLHSPLRWGEDAGWKRDYANAARLTPQERARRREAFEREKGRNALLSRAK